MPCPGGNTNLLAAANYIHMYKDKIKLANWLEINAEETLLMFIFVREMESSIKL